MRKLFKYLHTCKKEAILTPIFVLLEAIFEILIPIFMGRLIDQGIKTGNTEVVWNNGMWMVIFAVFALISGILATRFSSIVSTQFGRNLRKAQYEKIQSYAFENIDHFSTSSLITRMTMDVSMIQNALQMNIRVAFRAPSLLIFSIISAYIIGGNLALVFVLVVPLLGFGLWFIMSRAHKYFLKMFTKIDTLNLTVQETLTSIRTVKSYVQEDYEGKRFDDASQDVSNNAKKAEKWVIFNNPLMQLAISLCFVLIAWFGARYMVYDGFTEGQFANIITYVMQILISLMMLSQVFLMIVISKASVKRVVEVLEETSSLVETANPLTDVKDGSFSFKDVTFGYEVDKPILKQVTLDIPSGSFVGIFGATGSGKSTFVQLISRLYDVNQGEVSVGGENVKSYALDTLRANVITVLQTNILFSGTIRDNMRWGKKDATDEEVIDALKKAQAYEFVEKMKLGLDTWIEQGGVNVSGGQRQRLCIARALIASPKILIMDDSTSAVDVKTDAKIRKALREETPTMTKVVVSQRLSSIEDANIIIILDHRGIQAVGNHETLYKTNDMYREVYDMQLKGKEVSE